MTNTITIVEVGPRDGFQSIPQLVPLGTKLTIIRSLYKAGVRRMETTAFVSPNAVPQLADAAEVVAAAAEFDGLDGQVLVPNLRQAERALAAGARHLAFVLSVSEQHNHSNVRATPSESVEAYAQIVSMAPAGTRFRLNLATAFDCPFEGAVARDRTLALLDELVAIRPDAEICPCDTTGRVTPDRVESLFTAARSRFPQAKRWAYHGHDTYGLGVANALAAIRAGVSVVDAAIGGLGGCPFAPGATGNVATEDLAWTLDTMNIKTGLSVPGLVLAAEQVVQLPGAQHGGRVRTALTAAACRAVA